MLAVFFIVMTRGLEGHGRLTAGGETGAASVACAEVGPSDRGLAGKGDLGAGGVGGCVGELIEVDEGVEILVIGGVHSRLHGMFCESSHDVW